MNKQNLTVNTFFDDEEKAWVIALFTAISHNLKRKGKATANLDILIRIEILKVGQNDAPLGQVISLDIAELIFSEINHATKVTDDPNVIAALTDLAWKIQDYLY